MKKVLVALAIVSSIATNGFAHLCNDVFIQAKDNLAVKVDIRDGQLRINQAAEFRVYLLNTMDRDIANINLKIETDHFDTEVTPASDWRTFPRLKTKNKGGKKEYFIVKLIRKQGTEEGKYKIGLCLYNEEDSRVFKTVDINDAIAAQEIPENPVSLQIDGTVEKAEWEDALLCTSLHEYSYEPVKASWISEQGVNHISDIQTRFRFSHDDRNLYCMIDFETKSSNDIARIYVAKNHNSLPKTLEVNLQQKRVSLSDQPNTPIKARFRGTKVEIELPLELLKVKGKKSIYVNMTRTQDTTKTYWRGNEVSVKDPIIYATFVLH